MALLCYILNMTPKKRPKRSGATSTFSVSVDAETKAALRALADSEFGGNMSALVTDFAEEARRRQAAGEYLRRHGISKLTPAAADALQAQVDADVAAAKKKSRHRKVA